MHRPVNEAELAEVIAGAETALCVQGGGTRELELPDEVLSMQDLRGVELYEPGALTLVAKAGTPLAEVEALLASEGQQLAFEPMDHRGLLGTEGEPTIGGVIAANVSGSRRIQVGAARDALLGVRFVDGLGQVIKNGGRVMKNVTGYDLVKLMAGAHGTLGVLSEVSLKVLPRPEAMASVVVQGLDLPQAIKVMSAALGSPYDVTGAAFDPTTQQACIRVEGFSDAVAYRCDRLVVELATFGDAEIHPDNQAYWKNIRDVAAFEGRDGDVWRLSIKPSDAVLLAPGLNATELQFDWGGGLIWVLVPSGTDLRERMARAGVAGHATLVRAEKDTFGALGRFHPQIAPLEQIASGLRQKFDPKAILNRGLMG